MTEPISGLTQDGGGSISWGEGGEIATEISRSLTGLERFNIGVTPSKPSSAARVGIPQQTHRSPQNGVNFVAKMGGMIRFWYQTSIASSICSAPSAAASANRS